MITKPQTRTLPEPHEWRTAIETHIQKQEAENKERLKSLLAEAEQSHAQQVRRAMLDGLILGFGAALVLLLLFLLAVRGCE